MQSLILILAALALCLSIVNAQCVNGVIHAQYAPATIPVFATSQQNFTIGGCPDPMINIRVGFAYTFEWTLPFHPFGIYNATGLVAGNTTSGPLTWTPTFADVMSQGFYYRCGVHPAMTGMFTILPPANINIPIWGNVTAQLYTPSPACQGAAVFDMPLPRFCDPVQNAFAVQCENISNAIIPVSYACNDCRLMAPVCDMLPQAMWPVNGVCAPSSATTSGLFTCPSMGAATMLPMASTMGVATMATIPAVASTMGVATMATIPAVASTIGGTMPPATPVTMMASTPRVASPSTKRAGAAAVGLASAALLAAVIARL